MATHTQLPIYKAAYDLLARGHCVKSDLTNIYRKARK